MFFCTHDGSLSTSVPATEGSNPFRRRMANSPSSCFNAAMVNTSSTLGAVHERVTYFVPTVDAASRATDPGSPSHTMTRHGRLRANDFAVSIDISSSAPSVRSSATIAPTADCLMRMGSSQPARVSLVAVDAPRCAAAVVLRTNSFRCSALAMSGPTSSAAAAGSSAIAQTGYAHAGLSASSNSSTVPW